MAKKDNEIKNEEENPKRNNSKTNGRIQAYL
jgi:hypothetical protein